MIRMRQQYVTKVSTLLIMSCTAQNDQDSPHPLEITWYKGNIQLNDGLDERYIFSYIHTSTNITIASLTISSVQKDDAGQYSCRVQPGDLSTETEVVVNCK